MDASTSYSASLTSDDSLDFDDTDQDEDYQPESPDQSYSSEEDAPYKEPTEIQKTVRGRKKVLRPEEWKRNKAKFLRNTGTEYIGHRSVHHKSRSLKIYNHNCHYNCNDFTEDMRKNIFTDFWKLGSWDLQTSFISSCIVVNPPKKRKQHVVKPKTLSTCVTLQEKRVCKKFLLITLDISNKRFTNVVKGQKITGVSPKDKRGKHKPANKMLPSVTKFVKDHIQSFRKFSSRYSRKQNPNRKYLDERLNVHKKYELYQELCTLKNKVAVKESYYRKIFNTEFNISFHRPYTDTCSTCDKYNNIIKAGEENHVGNAKVEKDLHLRKAEAASNAKKESKMLAEHSPNYSVICFDLQKTLPTPVLTCNKVYYSRQLWTYNFCIHDLASGYAKMFVWHEGEASRGSQEIGSCLLKYVQELPHTVTHIIAFSDNAAGQNKNKNIIKLWSYIVTHTHIQTVDHKFLLSGHSFMECDQDFGIIEKAKKKNPYIFVPNDWEIMIEKSCKNFTVVKMNKIFFSFEPMSNVMTDSVKGLRSMQWFHFDKMKPCQFHFKNTMNKEMPFNIVNLKLQGIIGRPPRVVLTPLYHNPPKIKLAKYQNLKDLLQFIPPVYHNFYHQLPHEENVMRRKVQQDNNSEESDSEEDFLESDSD